MTPPDTEVLSAGITSLGGQWRTALTRDVTHLFALSPGSDKYETAMHFKADTCMKVLLPHWFDDVVKLGVGLPTGGYEWPHPRYLRGDPGEEEGVKEGGGESKKGVKSTLSPEKKTLFQSVGWTDLPPPPTSPPTQNPVWASRKILLSHSLHLPTGRREAIEAGIRRSGGVVVGYMETGGDGKEEEEVHLVEECDVLVTRYRFGGAYLQVSLALLFLLSWSSLSLSSYSYWC